MMTLTCVFVLAGIVLVALWRKNSVKVHLQFLGAQVHLEAEGESKQLAE
jgi:hypothetical protein